MEKFDHIGPICKRIREGKGVELNAVAIACGYRGKDISQAIRRFENGDRELPKKRFESYVTALRLPSEQSASLRNIYESYYNWQEEETRLGYYSFRTIIDRKHPQLEDLVKQLKTSNLPSLIYDELLYVHAVNAPCLALFEVAHRFLSSPVYWHTIATKFHPNRESPVRSAYQFTEDSLYTYESARFFQETSQYFFTRQLTNLVNFLDRVSDGQFGQHWTKLTAMSYMARVQDTHRTFVYDGHEIVLKIQMQSSPTMVEIVPGKFLRYWMMSFSAAGANAEQIHQDITKAANKRSVAYAYEYVPDYNESDWSKLMLSST